MGEISGGGTRRGAEFLDPVVSVYPGPYNPKTDYDKIPPTETNHARETTWGRSA